PQCRINAESQPDDLGEMTMPSASRGPRAAGSPQQNRKTTKKNAKSTVKGPEPDSPVSATTAPNTRAASKTRSAATAKKDSAAGTGAAAGKGDETARKGSAATKKATTARSGTRGVPPLASRSEPTTTTAKAAARVESKPRGPSKTRTATRGHGRAPR